MKKILPASGLIAAAMMAATAVPAMAQTQGEDILVTGRYGADPEDLQTLSQAVSYADLDLSTKPGREELRRRVSLTARYLCDRLGEPATSVPPADSCRSAATKDAMARVGTLQEGFAPRGTGWVAPTAWDAPYPDDWVRLYP